MELLFSFLPLFLAFLLFIRVLMKKEGKAKTLDSNSKLPQGPWKLPLIGHIHLLGALPHRSLRDLAKKHGPLMHLRLGWVPTLVISSPEASKEIMKTHDLNFAQRPELAAAKILGYGCSDVVFAPYGDYWRQLKKICIIELLSGSRVQSFRHIREEEVSNLIQSVSSAAPSPVNLTEKLFLLTNNITSRAAIGTKCKDQSEFISMMLEAIRLAGGFAVADLFPSLKLVDILSGMYFKLKRIHRKHDIMLNDIIRQHKEKAATAARTKNGELEEEDLLDVLLRLQEGGGLEFPITTDNIKAIILDMFTAGSDTSSTIMVWAMSELMRNPRVMAKAQAEVRHVLKDQTKIEESYTNDLSYLNLVIKETLRLHPPSPLLLPRECRERCEIDGHEVTKDTRVLINAWAMGRDPQYWNDPESFVPERFEGSSIDFKGANFEFVPFGSGRRMCPGYSFGLANVKLPLAQLLFYFDWKIPNGVKPSELDMSETFGMTVQRRSNLCLFAIPCIPLPTY